MPVSSLLRSLSYSTVCSGPCKKLAPVLEALAERTARSGKVKFFAVDVDQARELASARGVKSMPTILFFRDGKLVKTVVGADVVAIKAEVAKATMNPLLSLFKSEKVCSSAASARFLSYPSLTAQALVCSLKSLCPLCCSLRAQLLVAVAVAYMGVSMTPLSRMLPQIA